MASWLFSVAIFLFLTFEGINLILKKTLLFQLSELFLLVPLLWAFGIKDEPAFLLLFSCAFLFFATLRFFYERFSKKQYYFLEAESFYFDRFLYDDLSQALYVIKEKYKLLPASLIFYPSGLVVCNKTLNPQILEELEKVAQARLKGHYLFSRILGVLYLYVAGVLVLYQSFSLFYLS